MSYTYIVAIEKHFIVVVVVIVSGGGVAIVVIDVDAVLIVCRAFDDAYSTERQLGRLFATAVQSRRWHPAVPVFTRRLRRRVDRKC